MNSSVSEFGKDLGLIHEVIVTGRKVGFTREHWAELAHNENKMREFLDVLLGHSEIKPIKHLIDFDAKPSIPSGWEILPEAEQLQNRVRGKIKFDPRKVILHLDNSQKNGKFINGNTLRSKLWKEPVYGAQLLDFYLANPHLIPKEWKGKAVFFWGTIYRNSGGHLCVRCLCWGVGRWIWDYHWLDHDWGGNHPAAVSASLPAQAG